jgi:hypothetical protein
MQPENSGGEQSSSRSTLAGLGQKSADNQCPEVEEDKCTSEKLLEHRNKLLFEAASVAHIADSSLSPQ